MSVFPHITQRDAQNTVRILISFIFVLFYRLSKGITNSLLYMYSCWSIQRLQVSQFKRNSVSIWFTIFFSLWVQFGEKTRISHFHAPHGIFRLELLALLVWIYVSFEMITEICVLEYVNS